MEINVTAVRLAMADAGMTVSQLAKKAHVSQATAVRYASKGGNGGPKTFHKIGQALGVKPSTLVLVR
ncbi:MAG: helix-turn-helix transcriptional regulator [Selenomonadaceae bacterium]|nr:helix-turn-helix transcriptional regulator [Selenomonadaceae bacterium]